MKDKARITLADTTTSACVKMADGNPGALSVLSQMVTIGKDIDRDDFFGGLGSVLNLDTVGIYGSRIWMLYKDVCGEDLRVTMALLRAWQLGFLHESELKYAIDHYGEGVDIPALVAMVEKRLPNFKRAESTERKDDEQVSGA